MDLFAPFLEILLYKVQVLFGEIHEKFYCDINISGISTFANAWGWRERIALAKAFYS